MNDEKEKPKEELKADEILLDSGETIVVSGKATRLLQIRKDYNRRLIDLEGKIPEDEPTLLFRAKDMLAPAVLRFYADEIEKKDGDPNTIKLARIQAKRMLKWQDENFCHMPDAPSDEITDE